MSVVIKVSNLQVWSHIFQETVTVILNDLQAMGRVKKILILRLPS